VFLGEFPDHRDTRVENIDDTKHRYPAVYQKSTRTLVSDLFSPFSLFPNGELLSLPQQPTPLTYQPRRSRALG